MLHYIDPEHAFETNILEAGAYFQKPATNPEALPIHLSTAHNVENTADLEKRYALGDYCYNRYRNPNREALGELMSYIEDGEFSIGCSSGMAAIYLSILSNIKSGDHVISDRTLYGETIEIFTKIFDKFNVNATFVDFTDLNAVKNAVRPNTTLFYGETVCNPLCAVADMRAIANIAHANNALLIIDNTFMTGALVKPLHFGADLVVNSLTKFANGHSDAVAGSITGSKELVMKCFHNQQLVGSTSDPFSSWLVCRGLRTLDLRIKKQSINAKALAEFFDASPFIKRVFYPSLKSATGHENAVKQFGGYYGGMLTIELEDDRKKMDDLMDALTISHYAMTLGGYRTTFSYPPLSSHSDMTKEERASIGINDGMLRLSVGIEKTEDLINDWAQALEKAYKK